MKAKIHFIIILLITLISSNSFSQGSGWVSVLEIQYPESMYEVQFVNNNTGFIGGDEGKLYKTTNAGLNWTLFDHNFYSEFNSIFFFDAQTGFMGGDFGKLYKTTDGGVSLDTIYPGLNDHFHSVYFPSRDTGYMATKYAGLLKSTNGGTNWIVLRQPNGDFFEGLFCLNNNTVFASGLGLHSSNNWQIFRSTDGGVNWDSIYIQSAGFVYSTHFTDSFTGYAATGSGKVYKTTNGGSNWASKLDDSSSAFHSVFFVNPNTGFVVGYLNSNYAKTTNAGETWSVYNSYLFNGLYSVYFIDANTGVAVGYYRIIRTTNGGEPIGIKPISSEIPKTFSLFQNFPNPFNPVTRIKYDIPPSKGARGMMTKLIIFDVLGKEVQTLVNQHLSPGTYEVNFDGSNFSSGVYYYRLDAGDYTETRKMVLIK
jgi:photosystem II stability/assembly factor-like uncharacterized protein